MNGLIDFRKKYPQYSDISDADLTNKIYDKFYSDIPREDFDQKFTEKFGSETQLQKPEWASEYPGVYDTVVKVREGLDLPIQAAGAIGGGLLGSVGGPVGTVGGAGLGYAAAKEGLDLADYALGLKAPKTLKDEVIEGIKNVGEGAALEFLGAAAIPVLAKGAKGVGNLLGKVADLGQVPLQRAARIAKDVIGDKLGGTQQILRNADPSAPAYQALGKEGMNSPATYALLDKLRKQSPDYYTDTLSAQSNANKAYLGSLAKGATQEQGKMGRQLLRKEANKEYGANLKSILAGARPIETKPVMDKITTLINDARFAGNSDLQKALKDVSSDVIAKSKNGFISPEAFEAIRKNDINAVIQKILPASDAATTKSQKALASKVLGELKPVFVEAMENAGAKGYKNNLAEYAAKRGDIDKAQLIGRVVKEYGKESPNSFIKLIQGESPEVVERILGPGKFSIRDSLDAPVLNKLDDISKQVGAETVLKKQSAEGKDFLRKVLDENTATLTLPNLMHSFASIFNTGAREAGKKLDKKTMAILTEKAKTARDFNALLSTMPATQRNTLLRFLTGGQQTGVQKAATKGAGSTLNTFDR